MKETIASFRHDYQAPPLAEKDMDPNPLQQFRAWFEEAARYETSEPNAMVLATATAGGRPSTRTLLLKELDDQGFVFYTNYRSRKGKDLQHNPYGSLLFYWPACHRQLRADGVIEAVSPQASDDYFASRPREAQLGAWASRQSLILADRDTLEERYREAEARFAGTVVPRPPFWGGYRLLPQVIEFWQGQPNRLHDRLVYTKKQSEWILERLMP